MAKFEATPEMNQLLVKAGSMVREESLGAAAEIAKSLEMPLRKGVLDGDITNGIFEPIKLAPGASTEFPLDFLAPGTEKNFVSYTIPNHGRIPERHVEGDYVMVPTYDIGGSIDMLLKYARDARWDVVNKAMTVLRNGFVQKINDDAWQTLLSAGVDRNIYVYDADAGTGQFTKRLVSLSKTIMRRNGGGNSSSSDRGRLTDIFLSPEAMEDIRNWGIDQIDEITRREIYVAGDGAINRVFSVNLHDLDELGEGQSYQLYYSNQLAGTLASSDVEIAVGLDLSKNDSFVMPIREALQIFEDDTMHRQRRMGWYGWQEHGFAVLDNRRVLILSL
jgi:hypothetical protein